MDKLAKQQSELSKKVSANYLAYQRLAEERKTAAAVKEKLQALEEAWATFEAVDDLIRKDYPGRVDHLYFTEDLHGQMVKLYKDFKGELEAKSQALSGSAKTSNENINGAELKPEVQQAVRRCHMRQASLLKAIEHLEIQNQTAEYYEAKINRLKADWASIQEDNVKIHSEAEDPTQYGFNISEIDELDMKVQDVIIKLSQRLNAAKQGKLVPTTLESPIARTAVKLPTITIPQFDGDYLKWTQFQDMFLQMIDKQPIEEVEKMWYLKSNVTGEAGRLIQHLTISAQSYNIAWKILSDRYDNKRLLVASILERLLNQPTVLPDCARSLKKMYDTTQECVLMLENNEVKVKGTWDPILLHILIKKLDRSSHSSYEQSLKAPRELQSLSEFLQFIETRFQSLETLGTKAGNHAKPAQKGLKVTTCTVSSNPFKCVICGKIHYVAQCERFVKATVPQREALIKEHNLCFNCLKKGHVQRKCGSTGCKKCNQKHHTLLHQEQRHQQQKAEEVAQATVNIAAPTKDTKTEYVFLATAIVTVWNKEHKPVDCRVLLDSGSQINLISERLQRRLQLDKRHSQLTIYGIGNAASQSKDRVTVEIRSKSSSFQTAIEAQVIRSITNVQPQKYIDTSQWQLPKNITLADPNFNTPQKVDMLLGAEMYGEIIRSGQIKLEPNLPSLHNSVFGWIILGKVAQVEQPEVFTGISNGQLEKELEKFWELEEISSEKLLSANEKRCEEFFRNTTTREKDGRFIVNLPILGALETLGDSKGIAWRRYLNLERKLQKDTELCRQYTQFLEEYLQLGHMREIEESEIPEVHYFLPHHCVLRPDKSTTKTRVVFDASCKTTSNISLNDLMLKGAKIQDDLIDILIRFRTYTYAIMGDIKQMFRQIKIAPEDQHLQIIIWRPSPKGKIRYFVLCTVTYGTKAAPYLATRCLHKLAEEEKIRYPLGSAAIQDFYMDDVITGADTLHEAIEKRNQIIGMLAAGKFELHKWAASDEVLLTGIPLENREKEKMFESEDSGYVKTLGLSWQKAQDNFTFTTTWPEVPVKITKREIVSEVARLFDPLGLVSPVTVKAKIFIQKLWKQKLDWDQELDEELQQEWLKFRHELSTLHQLKIGRNVMGTNKVKRIEMHVFADASEVAYGAVSYIRTIDIEGKIQTRILCSKSRVAPVKTITLPRLELCAAQLAAELAVKVQKALNRTIHQTYFWSDSQVVLSWIRGEPATFKTYVAHRIAVIQEKSQIGQWNYVHTKTNPADLVSRGTLPSKLKDSELWFWGPEFLNRPEEHWPIRETVHTRIEEEERVASMATTCNEAREANQHPVFTIDHRNSFTFLQRVLAYVARATKLLKGKSVKREGLTTLELREAQSEIIKAIQQVHFKEELAQLTNGAEIKGHSRLTSLSPFLDKKGIIRVGGRLHNAEVRYEAKHPALLPGDVFVSRLILDHLHKQHLHAGPSALLAIARQQYWILQGRTLTRAIVAKCTQCVRSKPQLLTQKMGNLPRERVLPSRAFLSAGVDFCGPIWTHYHLRGKRPTKSYIAVFCCFATKAVHLEVVSDLTTDGFIGALRRFMARRGYCKDLFCDNATNFVGAKNKLNELAAQLNNEEEQQKIMKGCTEKGIQFHFSPPRAPHFGGLWEAAVKSVKKLLQHTLTSASLTFEELNTIAAEAEAILNSRPLTPLSSDPNDLSVLTPGHFLIGEPLTTIPDPNYDPAKMSGLTRWKLVSAIRAEFWKRWTKEYLSELQRRYKWKGEMANVQPGMIVILKEENTPPLKWPLGRIEQVITGNDGLTRVAIVRTATGTFKRAIHRLALLPVEESNPVRNEAQNPAADKHNPREERCQNTATKRKKSQRHERPRRTRHSLHTMFVILAVLMFPLLVLGAPQIKEIHNNAGIYLEDVGTAQLAPTNWQVIIYRNLSTYWQSFKAAQKATYKLKSLVESTNETGYLPMICAQYEQRLKEIEEGNKLLFSTSTRQQRKRRGLLNFVGNVANKLFGVLDDNYANRIEGTIKNVQGRQDYLLELMKNQTSVIESSSTLMQKSEEDKRKQLSAMQREIEKIAYLASNMTMGSRKDQLIKIALLSAQYTALIIDEVQRTQQTFTEILTDIHQGKVNPGIAALEELNEHLSQIQKGLPVGLEIPRTKQIFQLVTIKGKLSTTLAMFVLRIPLVFTTQYELLHLVPFPVRTRHSFWRIVANSDFLMINAHRDSIYRLEGSDLEKCSTVEERHYICEQQGPLYTKRAPQLQCEIQLITQRKIAEQCKIKITKPGRTWIELREPNKWLYSMDQESIYNMVCDSNPIQLKLNGSGILTMGQNCILRDDELTIQAYHVPTTEVTIRDQPVAETPVDLKETLSKEEIIEQLNLEQGPFEANLRELQQKLKEIRNKQASFPAILTNDQHQYTISYAAFIIAVIMTTVFIIKYARRHYKTTRHHGPTFTKEDFRLEVASRNVGEDVKTEHVCQQIQPSVASDQSYLRDKALSQSSWEIGRNR